MKPYKNLSGNSNIKAFQNYGDGIKIQLTDGSIYLFLYEKTGKVIVDQMQALAKEGMGLAGFLATIGTSTAQKLE